MVKHIFKILRCELCGVFIIMHEKVIVNNFSKPISYQSQPAFICSKLTIETLEQGVKYVQS